MSSGEAVVIVLVVVLLVALLSTRVKPAGRDDEGRPATWYVNRALIGVLVVLVLAAMSDGCEPEKSKPDDATTTIERVTCTSYREEDCPPVPAPPAPIPAPPATPNTAGIPDGIGA